VGLPWYRVHTVVLNDPSHLFSVHIMHTTIVVGWVSLTALYELAVFYPSNLVLDLMWRQVIFVIPFMTCLGITNSWGSWNITGGAIMNPGIKLIKKKIINQYFNILICETTIPICRVSVKCLKEWAGNINEKNRERKKKMRKR